MMMMLMVAPMIGGMLVEILHWRAIFGLLAISGLVLVTLAWASLAESLDTPDLDALTPRRMASNWHRFVSTRECVANAALQSCSFSAMYAYISGSPFVLITGFGVPAWAYGFFFASTAMLMVIGNAINSRTMRQRGVAANRRLGILIAAIACALGVGLAALRLTGVPGILATMAPVWVYICANGIIMPNTTAGVMEPHPDMAGAASAILGAMQMTLAMCVGFLVTLFFDGSALSMAIAMAVATALGLVIDRTALADR